MKKLFFFLTIFISLTVSTLNAQAIKLNDYLLYPRLDSSYWEKDFDALNSKYSNIANKCQTCVYKQTNTTRGRFCFNTSLGHIQLDTNLHNFLEDKLIGRWSAINFGQFEIVDSILPDSKVYYRREKILAEQAQDNGFISFTDKRMKTELKNIKEIPNKNKRYKIVDGKFLTTHSLSGYCGATIIGMTKDGFLILDDHTIRTVGKKGKCLIFTTSIRRIILKKISIQ